MKKIFSIVALLLGGICLTSGCSCSKNIYKFDSVIINDGTESKTYTCSNNEKKDITIKTMCNSYEKFTIELKGEDKIVVNWEINNMDNEEEKYKIENGYLYMSDGDEWMKFAKYSKDKLIIENGAIKIILKR